MITVLAFLYLAAFIMTLFHAAKPAWIPLWVPVLIVCIGLLVEHLPLGR